MTKTKSDPQTRKLVKDKHRQILRNKARAYISSPVNQHRCHPRSRFYIFGVCIDDHTGRVSVREDFVPFYLQQTGEVDVCLDQLVMEAARAGWKW